MARWSGVPTVMECELQEYGDRIFQRNGAAVRLNTVLRSLAVRRMMKRYRGCVDLGFMSVNAAKLFAARDIELDTLRLTLWVEAQSNEADANLAEEDEAARIVQGLLQGHISRCVMKANPQSRWVDAIIDYRPIISHPHAQEQHRARGALLEELVAKHGHRSQAPSCGFFPFTAKHEMLAQLEAPSAEPEGFLEDQQHMPADPVVSEQPHKNLYAVDEDDEDFQEALEAEQVALALRTPTTRHRLVCPHKARVLKELVAKHGHKTSPDYAAKSPVLAELMATHGLELLDKDGFVMMTSALTAIEEDECHPMLVGGPNPWSLATISLATIQFG
jgi:hypothetical protein